MLDVLTGFLVVVVLIVVGFTVGRMRVLGPGAVHTLTLFVFSVATPALLVDVLAHADLGQVFGVNLAVAVAGSLLVGALAFAGQRLLARRPVPDSLVTMLAASYCNGSNLGVPIAAHVLGNPAAVLPVIIFQVAVYGPLVVLALDLATRRTSPDRTSSLVRELLSGIVRSPLIIAAVVGVAVALLHDRTGFTLPQVVAEPVSLLAGAAVPVALLAFGMSMADVTVLDRATSPRRSVLAAAVLKSVVHPVVAATLGAFVFGLSGPALLTITVVGALPTAQNVFTYAHRFRVGTVLARDTGVVSTGLSLVSIAVVAALLG
ncbi:AEC family transporter [Corynebacterium bovis]|uniref:AEC family transporter n=1 Tax=Corynebacterium bovis TaxID=36808 RepID=UPI000F63DC92|nr:AEC family transporter [Corynebacterium bovis]RRO97146.1 AEC family transporter [Corynebacterium bovis]RRO97616.1 AEC family transporter [Corynebacterium bovis]RRQ06645.1 AEC family transporter [Corynebacterium bovis]RRQ10876.1 AEC family transporter [Corynebacterium bovis]